MLGSMLQALLGGHEEEDVTSFRFVTDPPLQATTRVRLDENNEIKFKCMMMVPEDLPMDWDLELWHNDPNSDSNTVWTGTKFVRFKEDPKSLKVIEVPVFQEGKKRPVTKDGILVQDPRPDKSSLRTLTYTTSVPVDPNFASPNILRFTIRYRKAEKKHRWAWVKDLGDHDDGEVLCIDPTRSQIVPNTFADYFLNTEAEWKVEKFDGAPGSSDITFDLTRFIPEGHTISTVSLGQPAQLAKFYCLEKQSSPWMQPFHGSSNFISNRDALLVGMYRKDGLHVAILGVADAFNGCTSVIKSNDKGEVISKTRNDREVSGSHRLIVGVSDTYEGAVGLCFARLKRTSIDWLQNEKEALDAEDDKIDANWYQNWYDGLTYCTWNGLGPNLTEQKILDTLADLEKNGIKISTLIIDDNWQTKNSENKWVRFEADPVAFPGGLARTTSTIKAQYPYVKNIIVWHAMLGYWEGFAPDGEIAAKYKVISMKWHGGWDVHVVDPFGDEVRRMYDDFYRFLSESGVDGVKCDVQCSINELDSPRDRLAVTKAYQDAFKLASLKHFGRKVIYCMAMQPYIMQNALLSSKAPPAVLRNSDDFFPDIADSHAWHIFTNAHNAIYTSHLNCLPDWDMFQTTLATNFSRAHALARVISGGPIYITDKPGKHNLGIVNGMCARKVDGSGIHITARLETGPSVVNPYEDKHRVTWLRNSHGAGKHFRIIAGFNTGSVEKEEVIKINAFNTLFDIDYGTVDFTQQYLLMSPSTDAGNGRTEAQILSKPFYLDNPPIIKTRFGTMDSVLFTLVPTYQLDADSPELVAILGLTSQFCAPAAILESQVKLLRSDGSKSPRISIEVRLKALGTLSIWLSDASERSIDSMFILVDEAPLEREHVKLSDGQLQIDLIGHKRPGYVPSPQSGEVRVKVML